MEKVLDVLSKIFTFCLVITLYIITYTIIQVVLVLLEVIGTLKYDVFYTITEYVMLMGWVYGMWLLTAIIVNQLKNE